MKKQGGFTLVEMLIVVVIIAILARLAIASYQDSLNKGRRSQATAALLQAAQQLERYYSANGRYTTTVGGSTLAAVFPTAVPANGTAFYTIAAQGTPTDTTYTLRATRVNTGVVKNDKCGDFEVNQAGAQSVANYSSSFSTQTIANAECIKR